MPAEKSVQTRYQLPEESYLSHLSLPTHFFEIKLKILVLDQKLLLLFDVVITDLKSAVFCSMGAYEEKKETCGTICLKYLLFTFNFLFWVSFHSGIAEPAPGI